MVKVDVAPLYVSLTLMVTFEKLSTCSPVDFAETLWSFGVASNLKTGAAFLFFV